MKLPTEAAVMTLPNAILFPHVMMPLYIFEPRYRRMLADALNGHRMFCVAVRQPGRGPIRPEPVAGLGLIRASVNGNDGTSRLILEGIVRVELGERVRLRPYRIHRIRPLSPPTADNVTLDALMAKTRELAAEQLQKVLDPPAMIVMEKLLKSEGEPGFSELKANSAKLFLQHLGSLNDPGQLADAVAYHLLANLRQRQAILATVDPENRLKQVIHFLLAETRRRRKNDPT